MIRRFLFSSAFMFGLASGVLAQTYEVVGLVMDSERGEPAGGVEIRTLEGVVLGVSQSTGRFEVTVNNRRARILFRRQGYKDLEVDLGELPRLIDVEIALESGVQELGEITGYATRRGHDPSQAQSIEELELMQGMRMDLNDHLRQMHGVAGMNEFTGDVSVHGSRTRDVTHYLGRSRIPSLRHLDFGFPGNQSVLNPRLIKSVTLSDNPAKGPVNQGNASALVYDLRDGDPEAIHGDLIIGSSNREGNLTGYWGGRTLLGSFRFLDPNGLGALGRLFFTTPKDARLRQGGQACGDSANACNQLEDPFQLTTGDLFLGTFRRDTTGAFRRHTLVVVDDNYRIDQDVGATPQSAVAQTLVKGFQGAWLYAYEAVQPAASGEWEWGLSLLSRDYDDVYRDTLPPVDLTTLPSYPAWYIDGQQGLSRTDNVLGQGSRKDLQSILSLQWSPVSKVFGAQSGFGLELEYLRQEREFFLFRTGVQRDTVIRRDVAQAGLVYRLRWSRPDRGSWDASLGAVVGNDAPWRGEGGGLLVPLPLASLRYAHPLGKEHKLFVETALRQSLGIEPDGLNRIAAQATSSAEFKLGGDGAFGPHSGGIRYAFSGYTRWYRDPALPAPETFWNYAETRSSDFATVNGANATFTWLPSHHAGVGVNASTIQGDYHLREGGFLPWESNRTLDLMSSLRVLPRNDSLLSFIFTYGINNGSPLYEYRGLWTPDSSALRGRSSGTRAVYPNTLFPEVSRQRVDLRINLDLKSRWRPLESMRFFFEADNLFADWDGSPVSWLGGSNQRRRGWTRTNASGDLQPVVTRGLGFFIMFGLEGKLKF